MRDFLIILVSVGLGSTGQVLFKRGMQVFGHVTVANIWAQLIQILLIPYIPLGFLCFGVSSILWLVVVSKLELSYAYPMVSLGYVVVVLSSWLFLGEELSLLRIAGLALICVGVALVSKS
jgi:multidrug transporter EmrE-like cation transporter